ncbi:GNAT family protein [Mesorhizobium sp. M7D.F.Ca.US.004.03.1.1]|uniref:GNAT family N-acetyltransferase n=1 Tax=Mesorhizobium sp. M7D.F.Ca.US.004.03.1.1 TaxID=2496702 RepID=UPI001FDFC618|nr:GNAT family protein [Mesorhizobium sp. M7D.F.Ca.US.004.03.1.1]
MFRLLFDHNEAVAQFVADLTPGCEAGFGNCKAIGVIEDGGDLVAGMVFHDWQPGPGLIQISSASKTPRWLTADVRHIMFSYPFDQIGCQMVVLQVSAKNERMVRIAKAFGFTPYLIKRMRGRDEDGYVFTLTDDDWRNSKFTRKIHGQA